MCSGVQHLVRPFPNFDYHCRGYISLVHKAKSDEGDISTVSLADAHTSWGAGGRGDSATGLEGFHMPGRLLGQGGDSSKGNRRRTKSAGNLQRYGGELILSKLFTLLGPIYSIHPPRYCFQDIATKILLPRYRYQDVATNI